MSGIPTTRGSGSVGGPARVIAGVELRTLLRQQYGVVSLAQARRCGLSERALGRRRSSGELARVHPGVYRSTAHPWGPQARLWAAVLWAGPDATVIGEAAAWWWRLVEASPATIVVAVEGGRGGRGRPDVRVRRRPTAPIDRILLDGVAVTRRPATLLDVVAGRSPVDGARVLDRALLTGAVGLPDLRDAHDRTRGRWGTAAGDRILGLAEGGARSEAERITHRLLRRADLGGWIANHPVDLPGGDRALVDIAFPRGRLAIEIDGWAFHRDVAAFRRDAERQNALVLAGWTVLRVTWFDLQEHPERVVENVRRALRAGPARQ